jgi:hypothetical protein
MLIERITLSILYCTDLTDAVAQTELWLYPMANSIHDVQMVCSLTELSTSIKCLYQYIGVSVMGNGNVVGFSMALLTAELLQPFSRAVQWQKRTGTYWIGSLSSAANLFILSMKYQIISFDYFL